MDVVWCVVLILVALLAWLATWAGLPGNWVIVVAIASYLLLGPDTGRLALGWPTLTLAIVLALLGEILELVAGALGVAKAGGSRRSSVLALLGSLVGALVGLVVGVPVPLIGSLLAAVLFGGLGALAGAALGESWKGRSFDESLEVGKAAFVGRVLGTGAKILCGSLMVGVLLLGLLLT
ncbi:MAG: DUF456 domain-containing protein [Pirellulales bacterium]